MSYYRTQQSWRDNYNPLRGLNMQRIVSMEEEAKRGNQSDLQWFWHHMTETDVTVSASVQKRKAYAGHLDWNIHVVENSDPVLANEQHDVLRYAYERISNLSDAVNHFITGFFTGCAICEKISTGYGPLISSLDFIPPWHWNLDSNTGQWYFNATAEPGKLKGVAADSRRLMVHAPQQPLFQPIGRNFFTKQLALADWDLALENGANQSIFIIGPPGTTESREQEYLQIAEQMTSNMRGYLPNGSEVKVTDLASRSKMPYFERIEYCDKQIVMAATGGLLTMLSESGTGTLAGGAHSEGLMQIVQSDAQAISEIFQDQFDSDVLRKFFPHWPRTVYFQLELPQKTEGMSEIIEAASALSWSGYRIEQSQLEEKLGLRLERMEGQE